MSSFQNSAFSRRFARGYSKMKGRKAVAVATCPACHSKMVRKHHWGKRVIATDIGDPLYQKWFVDDEFDSSGLPNYVDAVGGRFG